MWQVAPATEIWNQQRASCGVFNLRNPTKLITRKQTLHTSISVVEHIGLKRGLIHFFKTSVILGGFQAFCGLLYSSFRSILWWHTYSRSHQNPSWWVILGAYTKLYGSKINKWDYKLTHDLAFCLQPHSQPTRFSLKGWGTALHRRNRCWLGGTTRREGEDVSFRGVDFVENRNVGDHVNQNWWGVNKI